jgi:phosphomannomutase
MIRRHQASGGMVVTASHNPFPYNGLKPLRADSRAPAPAEAAEIIELYNDAEPEYVDAGSTGRLSIDEHASSVHPQLVAELLDVEAIRRARPRVLVDSVNGAGGDEARGLLERLGAELIHRHAEPTGLFPRNPEPTAENVADLGAAVRAEDAVVGFVQDPDADRLAIIDETGSYMGEEYTLAIGARRLLERHAASGRSEPATVAANLSTSRMIDDVAASFGAKVVRTPVGEAHVAEAMLEHGAIAGGEGNGGIIWPALGLVRNSLAGIGLALEWTAVHGKPISAFAAASPRYVIAKEKAEASPELVASLSKRLPAAFPEAACDFQDGVRLDFADRWLHVRPSNTEPIVRLIAEAPDAAGASELIAAARRSLGI